MIEWSHIDHDILTIPAANSKNGRKHQIHLCELALSELDSMRRISVSEKYVFALTDEGKPIRELTKGYWAIMEEMERLLSGVAPVRIKRNGRSKARGRPQLKQLKDWSPRDIRRTVQTRMAEIGVRPDVVDRVLNHNVAGVRRHYDHYSYYPETKRALVRWEKRLAKIFAVT